MARREIDPCLPKDTFSAEFEHFQNALEKPFVLSTEIGVEILAIAGLLGLMSFTLNGDVSGFREFASNVGRAGAELLFGGVAITKGVLPATLATIRMAAVESGIVVPYHPITRGCYDQIEEKRRARALRSRNIFN